MKERPILFNGEMVKAILEDRKTKTRRIMKVQPPNGYIPQIISLLRSNDKKMFYWDNGDSFSSPFTCPYGSIGDRLWVRETWGVGSRPDASGCIEGLEYKADELFLEDPLDSIHLWEARTPDGAGWFVDVADDFNHIGIT